MLGQAAQATISYLKLPQGNSCFPDEITSSYFKLAVLPVFTTYLSDWALMCL